MLLCCQCGLEFTLSAPSERLCTVEADQHHGEQHLHQFSLRDEHLGNTSASQQYDKLYLIKTTKQKK